MSKNDLYRVWVEKILKKKKINTECNDDTYTGSDQIFRDFASLNDKAFGNLFSNPQKSFHTSPESSDSNYRGCQAFFNLKLNISIYQKKKQKKKGGPAVK